MPSFFKSKKAKAEARARRKKKKLQAAAGRNDEGGRLGDAAAAAAAAANALPHGESTSAFSGGKRKRDGPDQPADDGRGGNDALPSNDGSGDRTRAGASERVVRVPAGLTGKEARKFRKDARRKEREAGRDDSLLRFASEGGGNKARSAAQGASAGTEGDGKGEAGGAGADESRSPAAKKRRVPARSHPRINDLVAAAEAAKRKAEEESARRAVMDSVPPGERARYVALDCEMVGIGPGGKTSALARVSLVDWSGRVLLDTFVQVPDRVTDFRTFVSGVRARDIRAGDPRNCAMEPDECRDEVAGLTRGKVLVGHALKNDLSALMLTHPRRDIRDTARYRPFMRPGRRGGKLRPRKLRDLAKEHLDMDIQVEGKAHCSVDDARAAMELYKVTRTRWEKELEQKSRKNGRGEKKSR